MSTRDLLDSTIAEAKAGDALALGRLCEHFHPEIYRFLLRRLSPEDAQDLASEVCVRAVTSLSRQKGLFPAWLYSIARNLLVDHLRQRARRPTVSLDKVNGLPEPSVSSPDGEGVGVQVDLDRAMENLSEEQRELLRLRFVEGYTAGETGEILGKSADAVRAQQLRALRHLRQLLKEGRYGHA